MTLPLAGKVAIVTGAASGIGRATARRFAGAGARLIAFDRSDAVRDVAARLSAKLRTAPRHSSKRFFASAFGREPQQAIRTRFLQNSRGSSRRYIHRIWLALDLYATVRKSVMRLLFSEILVL